MLIHLLTEGVLNELVCAQKLALKIFNQSYSLLLRVMFKPNRVRFRLRYTWIFISRALFLLFMNNAKDYCYFRHYLVVDKWWVFVYFVLVECVEQLKTLFSDMGVLNYCVLLLFLKCIVADFSFLDKDVQNQCIERCPLQVSISLNCYFD